ncbi:MAG: hypothetical protein D3903_07770 [Candidatus Electrothrix sp. GM3_4]|nr:hypothetical protein [Candidatus Electrothrix sp. GM3_4]
METTLDFGEDTCFGPKMMNIAFGELFSLFALKLDDQVFKSLLAITNHLNDVKNLIGTGIPFSFDLTRKTNLLKLLEWYTGVSPKKSPVSSKKKKLDGRVKGTCSTW